MKKTCGRELFWGLVALALIITLGFVVAVARGRGFKARRLVRAELTAPLGAVSAVALVFWITNSLASDIGGPIDWVIIAAIALAGAGGVVMASYAVTALLPRQPSEANAVGSAQTLTSKPDRKAADERLHDHTVSTARRAPSLR